MTVDYFALSFHSHNGIPATLKTVLSTSAIHTSYHGIS